MQSASAVVLYTVAVATRPDPIF